MEYEPTPLSATLSVPLQVQVLRLIGRTFLLEVRPYRLPLNTQRSIGFRMPPPLVSAILQTGFRTFGAVSPVRCVRSIR